MLHELLAGLLHRGLAPKHNLVPEAVDPHVQVIPQVSTDRVVQLAGVLEDYEMVHGLGEVIVVEQLL